MVRQFINQLGEGEAVEQIFLASEKQLRTNRAGNLYLQVRLADRTGSMTAMLWNAGERIYESFDNGDFVRVTGTTQVYNGALQMIATRVDRADRKLVDEADFVTLSSEHVDRLARRLAEQLRQVKNVALRNLIECFLLDGPFIDQFVQAPAAVKHHHAYRGGLLEHVVSLIDVAAAIAVLYPQVDADLLRVGVFLHDIGKVEELGFQRELNYSDAGQLLGHITLGIEILNRKIAEAEKLAGEPFPHDLALRLKHMILSHHGEYEFGSPKLPMTLEALALHHLDTLDAKLHSFAQIMRDDVNSGSRWTTYQAPLGRKLFKMPDSASENP